MKKRRIDFAVSAAHELCPDTTESPVFISIMAHKTTTRKPRGATRTNAASTSRVLHFVRRLFSVLSWALIAVTLVIVILRWAPPPTSSFMLIRQMERLFEAKPGPDILYIWTPRDTIPAHAALAVVASEDQNFPDHWGFDLDAIARAMRHNAKSSRVRGASTISQQVAKNLFLWSGRSYLRKGLEAGLTVLIELAWSKERILEVYLNIAEFGDGTYGIGAAAKRFFGKTPDRLSHREAALLASVLPGPKTLSARKPSAYVQRRASWVQTQMRQLGSKHMPWP